MKRIKYHISETLGAFVCVVLLVSAFFLWLVFVSWRQK